MDYQYDLKRPLHIIFNENPSVQEQDAQGSRLKNFSELLSKFSGIQKFEIEYDLDKFLLLLQLLPNELEIYTWIHPNFKQSMEDPDHSFAPLIIADTLKKDHPDINFNLISRHPNSAPKVVTDKYFVQQITIFNSLIENSLFPQKVGDIRKIIIERSNVDSPIFDFAIVTALHEFEFESVKQIFNLTKDPVLLLGEKSVYTGSLDAFPNKKIVAIYQSDVGRTDSSTITTELIKQFQPKYVFMTGVCGGDSDTNFGDIVIAKFVFTFDKGKMSDKGFFRELEIVKTNEETLRKVREDDKKNLGNVKTSLISNEYSADKFKAFNFQQLASYIEPMACSAFVVDKENYFDEVIKIIDRKAIAVEMEGYGVARAAETTNSGYCKAVVIKSVMDNTTVKTDAAKHYASFTSALYLKCLLENGTIA